MLHARLALIVGALLAATLTPSAAHADATANAPAAPSAGSFDAVLASTEDLILLSGWLNAVRSTDGRVSDDMPLVATAHLESAFGDLRGRLLTARAAAGASGFTVPFGTAALRSALADADTRLTGIRSSVAASPTIAGEPRAQLAARLDALASALDVRLTSSSFVAPSSLDPLDASVEQLLELVGTLRDQGQLTLADTLLTLEQPLADLRGDLTIARAVANATGPLFPVDHLASVLEGAQKALADTDAYVVADQTLSVALRNTFRPRIAALAAALAGLVRQAAGAPDSAQPLPQCDTTFCFTPTGP